MKGYFASALAVGALLVAAQAASAAPLGLTVRFPDIVATNLAVNYDADAVSATVGRLTIAATGLNMGLDLDGGSISATDYRINSSGSTYNLTADINHAGQLVGGSLSISGNLRKNFLGSPVEFSGLQLSGNLVEMGFEGAAGGGAVIEFRFQVTGGYLPTVGIFGSSGEIILSSTTGTFGPSAFASDFSLTSARADTFVPTPASATAGVVLLGGLLACRRRAQGVSVA